MLDFLDSEKVFARVEKFRLKQDLSYYALAKRACVSQATIRKWKTQKSSPTLYLLESLSTALGITVINLLADDDELVYLPSELKELYAKWNSLTKEQKNAILVLINSIYKEI